jgi:hypothetical protein
MIALDPRHIPRPALAAILLLLLPGCGGDKKETEPPLPDTIPPAAVLDLRVESPGDSSVRLVWTAPGDDSTSGTASRYDVRLAAEPILDSTWSAAVPVLVGLTPKPAGEAESLDVEGVAPTATTSFALKTADETPNWSGMSNVATRAEAVPPAAVADLRSDAQTDSSIALSWTAPGDDGTSGTAARYSVRYSTRMITDQTWDSATVAVSPPVPGLPGARETMVLGGLSSDTDYTIALKTADEVPNWSALSNVLAARTKSGDRIPPAPVADLTVIAVTPTSTEISWTAPGDDGATGRASAYDIRYSLFPISPANWDTALRIHGGPACGEPGSTERFRLGCLEPGTNYHVAMKTCDEVPNWSPISNVAHAATAGADWPAPFLLALVVLRDARIGGRPCLEGDAFIGGTASGLDGTGDPVIDCGGCYADQPAVEPPAVYTDPAHYPHATYYFVRAIRNEKDYEGRIYDRDGIDITGSNTMEDVLSYNKLTLTFHFAFGSDELIAKYFDDATGIFHRRAEDVAVVVNFGEAPVGDPQISNRVSALEFDHAADTPVHATVINARFTGTTAEQRLDPAFWKGGRISVRNVTFEPYHGIAMIAGDLGKYGTSAVAIGTATIPALAYVTRDVVQLTSGLSLTGNLFCLRDIKTTGTPAIRYDSRHILLLPTYLVWGF